MARAIALTATPLHLSLEWLRFAIVGGCALALILAGQAFPPL